MPSIRFVEVRPLSERAAHFVFDAPFSHQAGQYVALSAEIGDSRVQRYYSIASPPRTDRRIEFCIGSEGAFASYLGGLQPGNAIDCSAPTGRMRLLDARRPTVYLAAGTGIAPMRAILLAQLSANPEANATLVLGARLARELAFRGEFEALRRTHRGFRLLLTVSRDDPGWHGLRGRVTAHLTEAIGERSGLDAYFCGPSAMVSELRERLLLAGVPDERQCFERY